MSNVNVLRNKNFSIYFGGKVVEVNGKSSWNRQSDASFVRNNFLRKLYNSRQIVENFSDIERVNKEFCAIQYKNTIFLKVAVSSFSLAIHSQSECSFVYYAGKLFEVR